MEKATKTDVYRIVRTSAAGYNHGDRLSFAGHLSAGYSVTLGGAVVASVQNEGGTGRGAVALWVVTGVDGAGIPRRLLSAPSGFNAFRAWLAVNPVAFSAALDRLARCERPGLPPV